MSIKLILNEKNNKKNDLLLQLKNHTVVFWH